MQAQIRLAESGHSYHYSQLSTVHALMQQIKKDFKIQLQDQKIILKTGEILKSSMTFNSIQEQMKKTIPTNNTTAFNPSTVTTNEMKQIQCIYIYNQKQLLKPIEIKVFNDQFYLKILKEKCKEMSSFTQNSYEFRQFNEKVTEKNIISMTESINKKIKTPFQSIMQRFSKFYENINLRNYTKMQISALLDLIQNQDKARKLLIRSIQFLYNRKTKKNILILKQKVQKHKQKLNQMSLKQNSSFFSSQKRCSNQFDEFTKRFSQIELKQTKFFDRIKLSKKEVTKEKFLQQEKITFKADKKVTEIQKLCEQNVKSIKNHFDELCDEIIKVNASLIKNKGKQVKDLFQNLLDIHNKISLLEEKVQSNIKQFMQMYLQLSKIHMKGQNQSIKIVFETYVQLIKIYEELDVEMRRFEKQFNNYKDQKNQDIKVSQFNQNRSNNMPLKKNIKSPNKKQQQSKRQKQDNKKQKQDSSLGVSRQLQISNIAKINSPIKNKIGKNNLKSFNDEITSKNFEIAIRQNKQLCRRLQFNRRLEGLTKYCSNLCQREQQSRRRFRNSKQFQDNKIDLLSVFNVPSLEIDYNQTSDIELNHLYKKWMKQNSLQYEIQINWQHQIVQTANYVSKTLTTYLASKSNSSQRQKSMQRILSVLSDTFYRMMKSKLQKQTQKIGKQLRQQIQNEQRLLINNLFKNNEQLRQKMKRVQSNTLSIQVSSQDQLVQENINNNNNNINNNNKQSGSQIEYEYKQLQDKYEYIEQQNESLRQQVKSLQQKILIYQQQVNQTTQKLIQSYQQSHGQDLDKLSLQINKLGVQNNRLAIQINKQKQLNSQLTTQLQNCNKQLQNVNKQLLNSNKQISILKSELQVGKNNLYKQFVNIQNLFKQIDELNGLRQYYQKQFIQLKNILADKQVSIIKLQKQLQKYQVSSKQLSNQQSLSKLQQYSSLNKSQTIQIIHNQQLICQNKLLNKQQQYNKDKHVCEQCKEQIQMLRGTNQQLQQQNESLNRQLKQILFKQTYDKQIQTISFKQQQQQDENKQKQKQDNKQNRIKRMNNDVNNITNFNNNKQNPPNNNNKQTSKLINVDNNNMLINNYQLQQINQLATKHININNNNFNLSSQLYTNNNNNQQAIMSQYYIGSQQQQWTNNNLTSVNNNLTYINNNSINKFTNNISIGKTIQQNRCYIFLPFSSDIYVAVTSNQQLNNYTNYHDYLIQSQHLYSSHIHTQYNHNINNNNQHNMNFNNNNNNQSNIKNNNNKQPIYILDLKQFNQKTNSMLRQCSLVLIVKVNKLSPISIGNKIMVNGKIQFALGFQDDDMVIKNYSHFLYQ